MFHCFFQAYFAVVEMSKSSYDKPNVLGLVILNFLNPNLCIY